VKDIYPVLVELAKVGCGYTVTKGVVTEIKVGDRVFYGKSDIVSFLDSCNKAYYNTNNPVVEDSVYDALRDYVEFAYPEALVLAEVGATDNLSTWPKTKHGMLVGSLEKARNWGEFVDWYGNRKSALV